MGVGVLLEESRRDVYNVGILGTLCTLDAGRLGPNQDLGSEGDPAGYSLKENREPSTKKMRLLQGPRTSVLFNLSPAVGLGEGEEESWRASPLSTALHDEPDGYAAG